MCSVLCVLMRVFVSLCADGCVQTAERLDVYDTLNVFMRRNPKENNFKAVLDTIRKLMNTQCVVRLGGLWGETHTHALSLLRCVA